ncbi:DUF222 domain-containing protein [Candidatus Poriferisocius sp.]|uniref:HNH endonuclease n=1 Tax=Candidatus Poriferisocius sp. TaxID=3101276 RepID=UPI003B58B5A7
MVAGFELVDYSGLGTSDLMKVALQGDVARRQLDGYLAGVLGRFGDLEGDDAMFAVCKQFGIKAHKANRQAKVASGLRALPDVLGAVKDGYISMDHAEMISASHARAPLAEGEPLDLILEAMRLDCDQFKKTLATREDQRASVDGFSRTERQRARRSAGVFDGDDDMVILHAELDAIAGQRVKSAMAAMSTRLLHHDTRNGDESTYHQRNADALVALMTQQPAGQAGGKGMAANGLSLPPGADESDPVGGTDCGPLSGADCGPAPQKTVLVVTAEWDPIYGVLQDAELIDGTPIEIEELRRLACDADIIPAIFGTDGQPLYLGRTQRAPNQAQRMALFARDQQCVDCGLAAQACEVHHILPWEQGGPTNIDNLVLLCPKCHHRAHQDDHHKRRKNGQHQPNPKDTYHRPTDPTRPPDTISRS